MIKRLTTTAILLMVVAAVGLALLVTPAEAAPRETTPPYQVGDRFTQSIEQGVSCKVIQDSAPMEGYSQVFWIGCKEKGYWMTIKVGISLDGRAVFFGDWSVPVR